MKSRIQRSIEYIAGYCNKHDRCENCPLQGEDGCKLTSVYNPCDWNDVFKKESEDNK